MKKWLPFFIALLIPVMIFVSFVFMIKNRNFIFEKPFVNEITAINQDIEEMLKEHLKEDVLSRFAELESRLADKKSDQEINDYIAKYKTKIAINDSVLEEIFISDAEVNILYFYNLSFSNDQMKELKWAVENQKGLESIKVHFQNNRFIFYRKFQEYYIFLTANPKFFMKYVRKNYPFFSEEAQSNSNAIYLNIPPYLMGNGRFQDFIKNLKPELVKNKALIPVKYEKKYLVARNISLKMNKNKIWDFDLYVYYVPGDFPMSIWHKLILVMTFTFVLIMFIMLVIRIKNASELSRIKSYGEHAGLWEDGLFNPEIEELTVLPDSDDIYSDEEYDESSFELEPEMDTLVKESPAVQSGGEKGEDEFLQVPDEYFSHDKEFKKEKDHELTSLIGQVTGHEEEIQRYNSIWKNIGNFIQDPDLIMSLNLFDPERNEYVPHFKKNVSDDLPTVVKSDNWILERYIYKGQALFVSDEARKFTPLTDIFNPSEYVDVASALIAPLKTNGEINGIIIIASNDYLNEETIREVYNLIKMD